VTPLLLQTLHFTGEPLSEDHFDELVRMHRNTRVMANLGGVRDDIQTRSYLDVNLAHWKQHDFGLWIVRDRRDDRIAGRAVLRHLDIEGTDEMEIGYALYPEWWGRGFATEIARELVRMGFGELGCSSLVAITQPDNLGSRHVLEKAGLSYEGDITHGGILLALYRIRLSASAR
jgi:RimJ/RimL family protein N-acetyltransferase